tara:strand:+ start:215 stop:1474 length:1260 start_codon:yes stop_codon:yes gene_type:complete
MQKNIKFTLFVILISAIWVAYAQNEYEELDSIIAIVEKDVITKKELQIAISELEKNENKPVNNLRIKKIALDQIIERKIINQYAEQQSIKINSDVLEKTLKNIALNNNISLEDLKKNAQQDGSLNKLYNEIRFQLTLRRIKERAIYSQINISDYEINKFLEKEKVKNPDQYNILHILIKINSNNSSQEKLKKIQELLKTDPFSQVAKIHSDGPFAEKGGNMGWLSLSDLPDLFVEKITALKENEISSPFESKNGLHIIKLNNIKSVAGEKIFSTQYNINQIILKNNQIIPQDELFKKLESIKNQISGGLSFGDAAAQYSEDSTSSLKNGSLGWVDRNNLLPEFQVELDKGKLNTIIGPFKTATGWILVELLGKREKDITEDSRKLSARLQILNFKAEIRYKDWYDTLKQQSNIEILTNN